MTAHNLRSETNSVKAPPPSAAADPLTALLDAAADRAVERALERLDALASQPQSEIMTGEETCGLLHVSPPTLRRLVGDGLPYCQMGSVRRYIRSDVIAWVRSQLPPGRPMPTDEESADYEREAEDVLG